MGEMPAIEDAGLSFWVQVFRLRFCIQELGVRVLGVLRFTVSKLEIIVGSAYEKTLFYRFCVPLHILQK